MKSKLFHYTDGGLKNVWLANGFEIQESAYGKTVAFKDVDGLSTAICDALAKKDTRLTSSEFRYLRLALGLSQTSLAGLMGNFAEMKARLTGGNDKTVKEVGGEQIGGRRTKAYELTVNDPKVAHPGVWTVWVDPETELPVRLADEQRGLILNFEDWNKEFDPKLFRLDIPEGYKLIEEKKE